MSLETSVPSTSAADRLSRLVGSALLACVVVGTPVAGVSAQPEDARTPEEALVDWVHFVKIGRFDVAAALANELDALPISNTEFVALVEGAGEDERFEEALGLALRVEALEEAAAKLAARFRRGKLERARSPEEIAKNIELLRGNLLGRLRGRERLLSASEYAMPQLLDALLQNDDVLLSSAVEELMVDMGQPAVTPLATALPNLDGPAQELAARILGRVGYRQALPALVDLARSTDSNAVRNAANGSVELLGGQAGDDPADLYFSLADAYYDERGELTTFPGEPFQLLWNYNRGLGLVPDALRTEVYHEAMAMRLAERAMRLDSDMTEAAALWIAANFSREIDSPDGYANPAYPSSSREALYYAVSAGPSIGQRILRRGLEDADAPLARRAIEALERTAGSEALVATTPDGGSPLLDAVGFSNRRVRYDAALAIAGSQPATGFSGAERVVPTLVSMVREADSRFAVVLTGGDREEYARLRRFVGGLGFEVLPPADRSLTEIDLALAETPGVELVVISASLTRASSLSDEARERVKLAATPSIVLVPSRDLGDASERFRGVQLTEVRRDSLDASQLSATIRELVDTASGGALEGADAEAYRERALVALRELAVAGNRVLPVSDAGASLVEALDELRGRARLSVAEVLAYIGDGSAQIEIMDAALDADGVDQVELLGRVADSAKRFGNMLEPRQVSRLGELVRTARETDLATAAAALMGALDLPNNDVVPLILGDDISNAGLMSGR
ncbi:MAG: hypothetical protein AAF235_04585 [Planctomycetota bacterium]